jgi:5-formyltetrahydrofolate cyclo-ligase
VTNKRQVRERLRGLRDALPNERRETLSDIICQTTSRLPPVKNAGCVALYSPIGSEVDTSALHRSLRERGVVVVYPRVLGTVAEGGKLEFVVEADKDALRVTGHADLSLNATSGTSLGASWGIAEPQGENVVEPAQIDVVITPGLGFDEHGGRLGYGGGYYDRTLESYRGLSIGIAFSCQMVIELPSKVHDRPMDVVVTEYGVLIPAAAKRAVGLL